MRIGVVGSRSFPQLKLVEWYIQDLPLGVTIISGGAKGVDLAAAEYAKQRQLTVQEHLPELAGCESRHEFTEKYYARNQKIADDCDLLVAFTEKDSGGTWDTIKRARRLGKPVKIIRPCTMFPGGAGQQELTEQQSEEAAGETEAEDGVNPRTANKGKGPFALKRISLGSYAIRRKCYVSGEEWADFITLKADDPQKLSDKLAPAFVKFFTDHKRLGYIHALTVPPRSIRNLSKPHVMDIAAEAVAHELGIEFVRLFQPWEKSSRGRHAKHGEISVLPEVSQFVGKVVWVLDDVTTTNFTLKAAVQSLMAMEIHAHGLAYMLMA